MRQSPPIQLAAAVIGERIFVVRGQKVMLDSDLAALYGVTTGQFNQAVERNLGRFPADFMFRLTNQEFAALKSQSVISKPGRGGRHRSVPRVFTEHGAIMAASVLNSPRAIEKRLATRGPCDHRDPHGDPKRDEIARDEAPADRLRLRSQIVISN